MSDPKLEICPQCGGKIERLIGPGAGIVFKGSGFYQTDYRSQDYQKKAKSEAGTPSPSTSKPAESQKSGDSAPKPAPSAPEPKPQSPDKAPPKKKQNPEKPAGA